MIYTHDTPLEFGRFKGTPVKDIPAKYLIAIVDELRRNDWRDFQWYVKDNMGALMERANKETVNKLLKD